LVSLGDAIAKSGGQAGQEADNSDENTSAETKASIDTKALNQFATLALQSDPLQADAFRLLALSTAADGDAARALSLMQIARRRSKRDVRVESWLFERNVSRDAIPAALENADAVLRVWPPLERALLPVLSAIAAEPGTSKPLVDLLATNPPWRTWFVTAFPRQMEDPQALHHFFSTLKASAAPPTIDEFRAYLNRMIELAQYDEAFAERVHQSSASWIAALGNINNGGFEVPVDGLPFGWSLGHIKGAATEIVSEGNGNKALRVSFYGGRVAYRHTSQLLLLRAGEYELSGRVRSALQNDRGLEWIVSCASDPRDKLGETERVTGRSPWTEFRTTFKVPTSPNCEAQELRLVLPARVPSESQTSGEIWYDDLMIARTSLPAAAER
jgi:hypothetical protein